MDQADFEKMSPEEMAEYQRQNCIFCKIIKGEIPARTVYEDDKVVCILDINPVTKGHMLMMPKEHYPFLPAIPPEIASHMFKITKGLAKATKEAIVTDRVTVFVANGGIAGQQSPHFIYHIVPRENGDNLENFNIGAKEIDPAEMDKYHSALAGKIGLMMREVNMRLHPRPAPAPPAAPSTSAAAPPMEPPEAPMHLEAPHLAEVILDNPELKEMIIKNPAAFKAELERNPELAKLFKGVDVGKLAFALNQMSR